MNEIIHGNFLEKAIPITDKFDVIIADPPYNIGKNFGNNNDQMDLPHYVEWCKQWINICLSKLTDTGILYIYGFTEILAHIAVNYDINKQRWVIWHYLNRNVPNSRFWQRSHEAILCLWNCKNRPILQIDQIREPYSESYMRLYGVEKYAPVNRASKYGKVTGKYYKHHENGAMPRDVIREPVLCRKDERYFLCKECNNKIFSARHWKAHEDHDKVLHPTQKPFNVTKKLLLSNINKQKGGKVLIPFSGSGSECVVAQSLRFQFLGFEINDDYVELGRQWLQLSSGILGNGEPK